MATDDSPQDRDVLFDERLAVLRSRFAARLRQDVAELAELAGQLSAAGHREEALRRIHALAHGLHGTAATFGQQRTGEAAAVLEAAAEAALAGEEGEPWPQRVKAMQAATGLLQAIRSEEPG